ncbi:MAG: prepilin-type N-terminal cleavage/methylation domain-containing protein [Porticoccaceae bacterium]|nr:prepilin-type N-terminal cleavage/methylation domain-containing protein [Porticoccaceae bacterium]
MRRAQGFTLIELLIVVAIIVILSAISGLAINQAFSRRYSAEADKLLIWLQQLSERSSLESAAYGIVTNTNTNTDNESREATELVAVVYFKNRWIAVTSPRPFVLGAESIIGWDMEVLEEELLPQSRPQTLGVIDRDEVKTTEKEFLLPEMAFLPDGYVEPQGAIQLSFDSSTLIYSFVWDDETSRMILEANAL